MVKKFLMNNKIELNPSDSDPEHKNLLMEKDQLLDEIKDIDLDYGLEKLGENDYKELRQKYRLKAAQVIKKIENYEELHDISIDSVVSKKIDDEIELIKDTKK
jgi:hypothetical protein